MTIEEKEIDHIDTPLVILKIKDLNGHQKYLLTLIIRFSKTGIGFKCSNETIKQTLGICERTAGRLLKDLAEKQYAEIENPGTKWRRVWLLQNDKTEQIRDDKIWSENNKLLRQVVTGKKDSTATKVVNMGGYRSQGVAHKDNTKVKKDTEPVGDDKNSQKLTTQTPQENTFKIFWQAYPKKVSRKEALKSWQKLSPDHRLLEKIMLALEKHKAQEFWHKENGRYIPNPATWLNAERWTDEIDNPQAEPDYSAALARYTHDCTEEEADELMRAIQQDDS